MSYLSTGGAFDETQLASLQVTNAELRAMTPDQRVDYLMRHAEVKAAERAAFWDSVASFATGVLPILGLLGIAGWFKLGGKGK